MCIYEAGKARSDLAVPSELPQKQSHRVAKDSNSVNIDCLRITTLNTAPHVYNPLNTLSQSPALAALNASMETTRKRVTLIFLGTQCLASVAASNRARYERLFSMSEHMQLFYYPGSNLNRSKIFDCDAIDRFPEPANGSLNRFKQFSM